MIATGGSQLLPRPLHEYCSSPGEVFSSWSKGLEAIWAVCMLRSCTRVGRLTRVTGRPHVLNRGEIVIGERVRIYSHFARTVLAASDGGRLEIGDRTAINYGTDISATGLVQIGADCLIGTHCSIIDNDYHRPQQRAQRPDAQPVRIGNQVWLGNRVIVLPGVTIGDGAVVAAGSVVTGNIPPGAFAIGNPARVLRREQPRVDDIRRVPQHAINGIQHA